ncbi:MAG: DUF3622 domain-containing protein [Gammaproteobacteria bacterium]|nr:DUF3622 domain-containing protein [Gammaproteobacteria bacterium]MDP2142436.1 DUF3622 domain-containing protein [Gammaproteobacteria bacterium]MDP2348775.1 DUF3622 domain-containing protein [Gammaproteobacteria bacterium]
MPKSRKYDMRVIEADGTWKAEIVRRASAKKSVVSKTQDGFVTEADAKAWAEKELAVFLELNEHNKRKRT